MRLCRVSGAEVAKDCLSSQTLMSQQAVSPGCDSSLCHAVCVIVSVSDEGKGQIEAIRAQLPGRCSVLFQQKHAWGMCCRENDLHCGEGKLCMTGWEWTFPPFPSSVM